MEFFLQIRVSHSKCKLQIYSRIDELLKISKEALLRASILYINMSIIGTFIGNAE